MSIKNTNESYGSIAIAIHWLMALIIITLLAVGFTMTGMEDGDEKWGIYAIHKATGLIIIGLAIFRWIWLFINDKPKPLENWSKADIGLSHATKWILMLLMLIMPIAGLIMSLSGGHDVSFFGLFTIEGFAEKNEQLNHFFHEVHEIGGLVFAVVIVLHILAALKHHFYDKDKTLKRMFGKNK
ncbi:MAG: cytochrome B [Gammaproteobacteria bacterium]|nr:MAG: cytochrome B [Gammaproteobacteria bacterium]